MLTSILFAIAGGAIIGLSASLLLLSIGRVAGISGILGGVLQNVPDKDWRLLFLGGLLVGGFLMLMLQPMIADAPLFALPSSRSLPVIVAAGLFVGFGVRMGNGCTSGHGVCGLTRFSKRSLVATLTFMCTGFVTATLIQIFFGGSV